ncbi:GntR family transcriptional regulator [Parapusillimonas sp. SGNA-6]|nr:GntR family transcriptional regulator [Parapusillimonas sp. SGNA-6]
MSVTLASSLEEKLRDAIVNGEYQPGEHLKLDHLRQRFDVSMSPLREALTRLSAEGFTTLHQNRGYRVSDVSAADFEEVTLLRLNLEVLALRVSISKGDAEWEDRLSAAYARLERLNDARYSTETLQDWEKAHRAFHMALFSACGMPNLMRFCHTLHDLSDRYRRLFLSEHRPDPKVPKEHASIYKLAIERDIDGACALLTEHLSHTGQRLEKVLRQTAENTH